MEKEKRYVITLDLFLYDYSDEEIKQQAKDLIKKINNIKSDSEASILEINEVKFGSIGNARKVN
ncbi:MAG: hypothetical protein QM490_01940 [Candidatus Gracilibacteria bacterium]